MGGRSSWLQGASHQITSPKLVQNQYLPWNSESETPLSNWRPLTHCKWKRMHLWCPLHRATRSTGQCLTTTHYSLSNRLLIRSLRASIECSLQKLRDSPSKKLAFLASSIKPVGTQAKQVILCKNQGQCKVDTGWMSEPRGICNLDDKQPVQDSGWSPHQDTVYAVFLLRISVGTDPEALSEDVCSRGGAARQR